MPLSAPANHCDQPHAFHHSSFILPLSSFLLHPSSRGLLIEGGFKFANGGEVARLATEQVDDLDRRAECGERVHLQDFQRLDARDAGVGVFLQQGIEDGAGLVAVLGEDVALLDLLSPLAAREGRAVESDVADEVESVEVATHLLGEFLEEDALGGEFLKNRLLLLGVVPDGEEVVERGIGLPDGLAGVVAKRLGDQPAVAVEVLDALGGDADLDVVDVVFRGARAGRITPAARWVADDDATIRRVALAAITTFRRFFGRDRGVFRAGFVDLDGVAVERGVGEQGGGPV